MEAPANSMIITLMWTMKYHPTNRKMEISGRKQHSFLYIEEGLYQFHYGMQNFTASSGDLVYIPKGSVHSYEILSQNPFVYQIEFEIRNSEYRFSEYPIKLDQKNDAAGIIVDIVTRYHSTSLSEQLMAAGSLYTLCSILADQVQENDMKTSRIRPAIEYLEQHFHEKVDTEVLAQYCCMSASQLRRCFAKEFQTTPTAYKNRLRIEKAKQILSSQELSIKEIAEKLGFDNIYVFSSTFKKHAGISPTEFVRSIKGIR